MDELHTYRGIFGSNVANVIRRLQRICEQYGAKPQFICCSATINNPKELASRLTGRPVDLIDDDGAPQSKRHFIIWNAPPVDANGLIRPTRAGQAERLISELMSADVQTIAFTRTRMGAEILSKNIKARLEKQKSPLADRVKPYRGGYLAEKRRRTESDLMKRKLLAVVSTSALQLGVDIGSLQGCVIVGYPGTIAGTWQQAGRAGRKQGASLAILVAGADPVDQYIAQNPSYIFDRNPEDAVIDPMNPYILTQHICCAAMERPLREEDEAFFGPMFRSIVKLLSDCQKLKRIGETWFWSTDEYPSGQAGLRTVSGKKLTIQAWDMTHSGDVVGEIDAASVPFIAHPEAVYLHEGETFLVAHVDYGRGIVTVQQEDVGYFTTPVVSTSIDLKETYEKKELRGLTIAWTSVSVTSQTTGYMRRRFSTFENLGTYEVSLEPVILDTVATYIMIDESLRNALALENLPAVGGIVGLKNLLSVVVPLIAMCDRLDIGIVLDSENLGEQAIFVFDRFDGGLGFSERVMDRIEEVLAMCLKVVCGCPCKRGCPSCVGIADPSTESPVLPESMQSKRKSATRRLLELALDE